MWLKRDIQRLKSCDLVFCPLLKRCISRVCNLVVTTMECWLKQLEFLPKIAVNHTQKNRPSFDKLEVHFCEQLPVKYSFTSTLASLFDSKVFKYVSSFHECRLQYQHGGLVCERVKCIFRIIKSICLVGGTAC